jgi:hypothetical protein
MDGEMQTGKGLPQAGATSFSHEDSGKDKKPAKEHVKPSAPDRFMQSEHSPPRHSFQHAAEQARHMYSGMSKEPETNASILSRLGQHEGEFAFPRKAEKKSKKAQREDEGEHGRLGLGLLSKGRHGADRTGLRESASDEKEEEEKSDGDSKFNFKNVPLFARGDK